MVTERHLFLRHLAQTSDQPLMMEVQSASGVELHLRDGKILLDLISGISVSNVGHCHPEVVSAVRKQAAAYMHVMVYGEMVQSPQVALAAALAKHLPEKLSVTYLVNSGAEAVEGAMKLAKRYTGRHELVAFENGYHGSTQGALSIMGSEIFRNAYRPLLPGIRHLRFNDFSDLNLITRKTAGVIAEVVQGEAGAIEASPGFLEALATRCRETGTLLILDEIQTGFRRTGSLMAFMQHGIVPDILVLAKGMGGGMPIGAFISSPEIMSVLSNNPALGHITTFGGHPVSCAAALAALNIVVPMDEIEIKRKSEIFRQQLQHSEILSVTGTGLLLAVEFRNEDICRRVIAKCIESGVMTDWFLFAPNKMRIAPPLIIGDHQIFMACEIILRAISEVSIPNRSPADLNH